MADRDDEIDSRLVAAFGSHDDETETLLVVSRSGARVESEEDYIAKLNVVRGMLESIIINTQNTIDGSALSAPDADSDLLNASRFARYAFDRNAIVGIQLVCPRVVAKAIRAAVEECSEYFFLYDPTNTPSRPTAVH